MDLFYNSQQLGRDTNNTWSPFSTTSTTTTSQRAAAPPYSDEEVLLASSFPKKRAGRKKFKETRHPIYRGVRQRNNNRWVCEVRAPGNGKTRDYTSRIWLGTYPTAEMAARAHDVAALALRGRQAACLNFADSSTLLRVPQTGDIKEIQTAAAEAAEAFRPLLTEEVEEEQRNVVVSNVELYEECGFSDEKDKEAVVVMVKEEEENVNRDEVMQSAARSDNNVGMDDDEEEAANCERQKTLTLMSQGTLLSPPSHHPYYLGLDLGSECGGNTSTDHGEEYVPALWSWSC